MTMAAMAEFQIIPLSEQPELADTCAACSFAGWDCQNPGANFEKTRKRYRARTQNTDRFPMLWVAMNANGKPMAMAGLKDVEHPDRTDLGPWLSSIYTQEHYRGQGVASRLIQFVTTIAQAKFGAKQLYLYSNNPASNSLYKKLGWRTIGKVRDPAGLKADGLLLMQKDLVHV